MSVEDNLSFRGYKNTVKFDLNNFYVMRSPQVAWGFDNQ